MVRSMVLAGAAALTLTAQEPAGSAPAGQDEPITIETPLGPFMALLRVPAATSRPPVVVIATLGGPRAAAIADTLQEKGVASLRVDPAHRTTAPRIGYAHAVTWLRNKSEQFPTVTVFAEDDLEGPLLGARAARADGVFIGGPVRPVFADEFKRLLVPTSSTPGGAPAPDAEKIAEFAKSVPAFGRRGGPANRPSQARRSPRRFVLENVGGVRVTVEWGSPQKRGREVWGSLVKWDAVWMPGADEATTMTTNGPVVLSVPGLATLNVPAGEHTLYTLPGAGRFELIVSKDTGQFHTVHAPELELGRIVMQRGNRAEVMEGLTFAFEPKDAGAQFKLIWDTREYVVHMTAAK